jgi:DNA polymerase III delta prime subunit
MTNNMPSWLESKAPLLFRDLLIPDNVIETVEKASLQSNPPHLLLSGPTGSGKTAIWRLIARQVLGPAHESTTHVLNAKDLARTSGAMAKFETFLRPEGSNSKDTLAGRTSLDAYDSSLMKVKGDNGPPAGFESSKDSRTIPISRIIVIEDADSLGNIRQSYLRRMMEKSSNSARFIFTTTTPSRLIEALRSRTQHIRIPKAKRQEIETILQKISAEEQLSPAKGMLGDIAHVANGNVRKAIFLLEVLTHRDMLQSRKNLQDVMSSSAHREIQLMLEEAMRGRVHDWKWEKRGNKNARVLKGAMGVLDQIMDKQSLEAEDIVKHLHKLLTEGRLHLMDQDLSKLIISLAKCEVAIQKTSQPRIELEKFMMNVADISTR